MNVLFLCTSNRNRSVTAENLCRCHDREQKHHYSSAGLSQKYTEKLGTRLCTLEMLDAADKIFVFESLHIERIQQNGGAEFVHKITNLAIDDVYQYNDSKLIALLKNSVFHLLY